MNLRYFYTIYSLFVLSFFGCARGPYTPKETTTTKKTTLELPPDLLQKKNKAPEKTTNTTSQSTTSLGDKVANEKQEEERFSKSDVKSIIENQKTNVPIEMLRVQSPKEKPLPKILDTDQLSVKVKNGSNKKLILTCFYYTKLRGNGYWKWLKSPIITLNEGEECFFEIKAIDDAQIKKDIYGYLGIFKTKEEAEDATFESLTDDQKIDLDRVIELRETTIEVMINKYGFKTDQLDYRLKSANDTKKNLQPELDFLIENKTEKPILACCFAYQKNSDQDSFMPWKYYKSKVKKLAPGEIAAIDIDTIRELYDWIYMRGFLAIFDANQEKEADEAIYELLKPEQKLNLGRLADILGKKISISVQKYGSSTKIFDFQPLPFKPLNVADLQKQKKKSRSVF
jgi:hypothetical protein